MYISLGALVLAVAACSGGVSLAIDAAPPIQGSYSVRAVLPVRFESSPTQRVFLVDPPPRPACRTDTASVYVITGTVDVGKRLGGGNAGSWTAASAIALSVSRYSADLQPAEAARRCSAQSITCWLDMPPFDARSMT